MSPQEVISQATDRRIPVEVTFKFLGRQIRARGIPELLPTKFLFLNKGNRRYVGAPRSQITSARLVNTA
jgi:hypothetical protein